MKFKVSLTPSCGDIVPLEQVAISKARWRATAGGTDFHWPAYEGSLQRFRDDLIHEVKLGRLRVCNEAGTPKTFDELIAEAKSNGSLGERRRFRLSPAEISKRIERQRREDAPWDAAHVDLGPSEPDWPATYIGVLHTTQKWLNEWAADRGDEFELCHDLGWIDERGPMAPALLGSESSTTLRGTDGAPPDSRVRDEATTPVVPPLQQQAAQEAAVLVPVELGSDPRALGDSVQIERTAASSSEPCASVAPDKSAIVIAGGDSTEVSAAEVADIYATSSIMPGSSRPRRRIDALDHVLTRAKKEALDPNWPSAWASLVQLAQSADRPPPLLGYVEGEGVKYQKDDSEKPIGWLTREAFRKRFGRQ